MAQTFNKAAITDYFITANDKDAPDEALAKFEKFLVQTAQNITESLTHHWPDWFTEAKGNLMKCIKERNASYKTFNNDSSIWNHKHLKSACVNLQHQKEKQKENANLAKQCKCQNPKASWDVILKE